MHWYDACFYVLLHVLYLFPWRLDAQNETVPVDTTVLSLSLS
jgi:hypothetical protein